MEFMKMTCAKFVVFLVIFITVGIIKARVGVMVKNEFANLLEVNEKWVKFETFKFYKKSRTVAALNVTYKTFVDLISDEQVKVHVSALRFINNEYKRTVVDFTLGLCTIYKLNKFNVAEIIKNSNLTGCPFTKGGYYLNDIAPAADILPPYFPEGKWMIDIRFTNFGQLMVHLNWLVTVTKTL